MNLLLSIPTLSDRQSLSLLSNAISSQSKIFRCIVNLFHLTNSKYAVSARCIGHNRSQHLKERQIDSRFKCKRQVDKLIADAGRKDLKHLSSKWNWQQFLHIVVLSLKHSEVNQS